MTTPPSGNRPSTSTVPLFDAYAPSEIAIRIRDAGVAKVTAPWLTVLALAILAGAFISLGALFYTITVTQVNPAEALIPFGLIRLIGGISFCLGLILVVVGGAELFTGNNLMAMAWASGKIQTTQVFANWTCVYLGNLLGALGTVGLVYMAGLQGLGDGSVGETAVRIAREKISLSPMEAFARGILCNALVCLAVWLCMGARSVGDKILAILFPISAFVAAGMEHSVANMYFLPLGVVLTVNGADPVLFLDVVPNLVFVTFGNILGGTLLVALVYWFVYLRNHSTSEV